MYYKSKKGIRGLRAKKNAVLDCVIGNAPRMKWYMNRVRGEVRKSCGRAGKRQFQSERIALR